MKKLKICFIASSGGHLTELKNLSGIATKYNSFLVTEGKQKSVTNFCKKQYFVRVSNRKEKFFLFKFVLVAIKQFFIFIKERPNVIITTGALCCYPMVKFAKMFRKKVVYIESYARIDDLSMTGKKLYKNADLFLVQWPELAQKYSKAKYVGSFFGGEQ